MAKEKEEPKRLLSMKELGLLRLSKAKDR